MLLLSLKNEVPLAPYDDPGDLVTWMDVSIRTVGADDGAQIGTARVALIHVAEALNRGISVQEVLEADGQELLALHDVLFDEDDSLSGQLGVGSGLDVLFFAAIDLMLPWRGRRVEEAIVLRVAQVWGGG